MIKTLPSKKALLSLIIGSSMLFSFGYVSHGDSKKTSTPKIQGAYYEVNGVEYTVPNSELQSFADGNSVVNLPYDPEKAPAKKNNPSAINPLSVRCLEGYEYDATRQSAGFKLKESGDRVINQTNHTLTQTSDLSTNATISGQVSGQGGWKWGPINAQVGFNIGGSYTWSTSQSVAITVDPGYWGWIDYGTYSEKWAGNYYYLTSYCTESDTKYLTVTGPKYKAKLAKTARYPG